MLLYPEKIYNFFKQHVDRENSIQAVSKYDIVNACFFLNVKTFELFFPFCRENMADFYSYFCNTLIAINYH